ncbi:unnamed protein product [Rhodiola kirilowii]
MGCRLHEYMPLLTMVLVQLGYAGMNITSKLAMDSGMKPEVIVTYRQIFATIAIAPFAYFLERNIRPTLTKDILRDIFFVSVFGATLNQYLYFLGLKYSTPTIACAINNTLPAITFLLAVPFGVEKIGLRQRAGQAKLIGTAVCVGGAMLLSFYNGPILKVPESGIHWTYAERLGHDSSSQTSIWGPVLVIGSCVSWAIWFIIQTNLSKKYPAPFSSTALMCLMSCFQCGLIGVAIDHTASSWSLMPSIRLVSTLYAGIVGSAFAYCLMSWAIAEKGPLYVSVFSPLLLVMVAFMSWGLLDEKLYVGTAVGSILIVAGLYAVLWGKNKEMGGEPRVDNVETESSTADEELKRGDVEMQVPVVTPTMMNGNGRGANSSD